MNSHRKGYPLNRTLSALIGAALVAASWQATAHGTEDHQKPAKTRSAAVEEKPFGRAGDPKKVSRTITVSMSDQMRYEPAEIRVKTGETVKLVVANKGKTLHEIVLGTLDELKRHADLMRKNPGMEHDEPHMAHVKAGGKEDLVWQFTKPGEFYYACLIPGHFEAGMVGKVIVATSHQSTDSKSIETRAADAYVEGEVRKVDKDAGKVTIKHGPLTNLDMPAMTMVFRAKDPAMLDKVKAGDSIRFKADKVDGIFTVTEYQPAR